MTTAGDESKEGSAVGDGDEEDDESAEGGIGDGGGAGSEDWER